MLTNQTFCYWLQGYFEIAGDVAYLDGNKIEKIYVMLGRISEPLGGYTTWLKKTLDALALEVIGDFDPSTKKMIICYYEALLVVESTDCAEENRDDRIRKLVEQKLNVRFDEDTFLYAKDFVSGLVEE